MDSSSCKTRKSPFIPLFKGGKDLSPVNTLSIHPLRWQGLSYRVQSFPDYRPHEESPSAPGETRLLDYILVEKIYRLDIHLYRRNRRV